MELIATSVSSDGRRDLASLGDQQSFYGHRTVEAATSSIFDQRKYCNPQGLDHVTLSILLLQDPSRSDKVGKARKKKTIFENQE